jgi:hypothetical protein
MPSLHSTVRPFNLTRITILATGLAILLAACRSTQPTPAQLGAHLKQTKPTWTGVVAPVGNTHIRGSVAITPGDVQRALTTFVSLSGGVPAESYAWRIRRGGCKKLGAIVDPNLTYPLLTPSADGNANAVVTLQSMLDRKSKYVLTITAPSNSQAQDAASLIGCAHLVFGEI